ncbi:HAD hydrolase-like protein [uncultured Bacteroides sp.]|uniref:HAD hydrolase-like protein n=1 Tax=uncultured Bacteroides sp. TaxID=162156 RepID=UPI002AA84A75|nr:HAD hydrolase-like protein [uncultured Bacteroides sp.]
MLQNVEMVVFDMAGTTVQDKQEVEKCFFEAVGQTGLVVTREEINSMMGWSKVTVFETLWKRQLIGSPGIEIATQVEKSYSIFKHTLENHYKNTPVCPTEGTLELFDYLKLNGIKIALTTGFYREVTDIILHRLCWDKGLDENYAGTELINASVSSDQVKSARPAPFMIFRAMELCHVTDVRKVIKIGDTPSDLAEGKNAGCKYSFGVTNGTHSKSELENVENDGLFDNINCFKTFLETGK